MHHQHECRHQGRTVTQLLAVGNQVLGHPDESSAYYRRHLQDASCSGEVAKDFGGTVGSHVAEHTASQAHH